MAFFFPDNTALINFHILGRWDLLEALGKENARWCGSVANECDRSTQTAHAGMYAAADALFGEPVLPTPAELQDTRVIRLSMADPADDHPKKHLGEAETIAIVQARFVGSRFVTDDGDAARVAKGHGIMCAGTGDVLMLAERRGLIIEADRLAMLAQLKAAGRKPRSFFTA